MSNILAFVEMSVLSEAFFRRNLGAMFIVVFGAYKVNANIQTTRLDCLNPGPSSLVQVWLHNWTEKLGLAVLAYKRYR